MSMHDVAAAGRLPARRSLARLFVNRFVQRVLHKSAFAGALLLAGVCALLQAAQAPATVAEPTGTWEWPTHWDGRALRPLAPTPVEQRFARQFPGQLVRLTDGQQALVMRHVTAPTRMLHPAADCYRALGWRIDGARLEQDARQRRWRCFLATRDGRRLRVCERITDAQGKAFTDTSAWYWAAVRGASHGPWLAVTTATPVATGALR